MLRMGVSCWVVLEMRVEGRKGAGVDDGWD